MLQNKFTGNWNFNSLPKIFYLNTIYILSFFYMPLLLLPHDLLAVPNRLLPLIWSLLGPKEFVLFNALNALQLNLKINRCFGRHSNIIITLIAVEWIKPRRAHTANAACYALSTHSICRKMLHKQLCAQQHVPWDKRKSNNSVWTWIVVKTKQKEYLR